MPDSHQDSSDSPPPSATPSASPSAAPAGRTNVRTHVVLFLLTAASVFFAGMQQTSGDLLSRAGFLAGAQFSGALLSILLFHEFGHYIAARIHRVDASLPFFIPMPFFSPFGTMGAVIRMRGTIQSRRALLDIGASGPLAGLCVAIPLYIWGLRHSTQLVPLDGPDAGQQLGTSLLIRALDARFAITPPEGMDIVLHPVAFAAWAGFLITMINLIPVAQLDGGHVAYALFGPRYNRIGAIVHRALLVFFFVSLAMYLLRDVRAGVGFARIGKHVLNSFSFFLWHQLLSVLGSLSARPAPDQPTLGIRTRIVATFGLLVLAGIGDWRPGTVLIWVVWFLGLAGLLVMDFRWGMLRANNNLDHPPTQPGKLGVIRSVVAVITLAFVVLLFMPTPLVH